MFAYGFITFIVINTEQQRERQHSERSVLRVLILNIPNINYIIEQKTGHRFLRCSHLRRGPSLLTSCPPRFFRRLLNNVTTNAPRINRKKCAAETFAFLTTAYWSWTCLAIVLSYLVLSAMAMQSKLTHSDRNTILRRQICNLHSFVHYSCDENNALQTNTNWHFQAGLFSRSNGWPKKCNEVTFAPKSNLVIPKYFGSGEWPKNNETKHLKTLWSCASIIIWIFLSFGCVSFNCLSFSTYFYMHYNLLCKWPRRMTVCLKSMLFMFSFMCHKNVIAIRETQSGLHTQKTGRPFKINDFHSLLLFVEFISNKNRCPNKW